MCIFGWIVITAALLQLSAGTALSAERMTVNADKANIRSEPSVKSQLLWQAERYYPVLVMERRGAWCRIKDFEGDQGWIHSSLLDKTPAVIVRVKDCNVRSGPSTSSDILFSVGRGIPFKVLQKKGDWFQVQHADGDKGWIYKPLLW